jgi:hypothetical protein
MSRLNKKFSDGSRLFQEPTGEDPLAYYLPAGDWKRAVAIEMLPLYEERKAKIATIRFWEDHVERLQSLADGDLLVIVERFVSTLSRHFSRWKQLSAEWPEWLIDRLGENALTQPFIDSGWQLVSTDSSSFVWRR